MQYSQRLSNTGEIADSSQPIYYAKTTINGKVKEIFATEAEVLEGAQSWDLNPLIFYRIRCPAFGIENLPAITPEEHFKRLDGNQKIGFSIMHAHIKP